jgi:hypothetical protein
MIGIHDSDLFWLAFIAAFLSGMACGWCLRDIRDAWESGRERSNLLECATGIATSNGRARWPISTGYACRLAAPVLDETAYSLQLRRAFCPYWTRL